MRCRLAPAGSLTEGTRCFSEVAVRAICRPAGCLLVLLAAGCGPVRATSVISDAEAALAQARAADGERLAPYQTVSAQLYLAKAREQQGRAQGCVANIAFDKHRLERRQRYSVQHHDRQRRIQHQ